MDPLVEVILSRPSFRVGGTIVGCVRLTSPDGTAPPSIKSLKLAARGFCRLDPRWHNVRESLDRLESKDVWKSRRDAEANTFCFWATEPVELLELQERVEGSWEDACPKPIAISGFSPLITDELSESAEGPKNLKLLQLAYSFRVDLPKDLPHSLTGTSCRYYYTATVRVELDRTTKAVSWMHVPLKIQTADPHAVEQESEAGRQICTVAHSAGLPGPVSASELHQWDGQLTVNRDGGALYRNVHRRDHRHIQSLKIADPSTGASVCLLTVMGANVLHPGSRLTLKLDFPVHKTDNWLPVYQVCACLEGEETAFRHDGSRQRARTHRWDTAHQLVDPDGTDRICMSLFLSQAAPCSVLTDTVEILTRCWVDIAVGEADGYRNLRMEVPCRVGHSRSAWEINDEDEGKDAAVDQVTALYASGSPRLGDPTDPASFSKRGIQEDIKMLSVAVADRCGLRPRNSVFS